MRGNRKAHQRRGTVPVSVLAGILIALPIGVLIGAQGRAADRLAGLETGSLPVLTTPRPIKDDGSRSVRVEFEFQSTDRLVAPSWTGLVTGVHIESNSPIHSGDVVFSIDGIHRVALFSEAPLHRDLDLGMSGPDVIAVQDLLVQRGLLTNVTGSYDRATAGAVRAFRASGGEVRPVGRLDRGLIVWLPRDEWMPGEVKLAVGSPAPPAGQTVVDSLPRVSSARVVELDGEPLSNVDDGWMVSIEEVEITLDASGAIPVEALGLLDVAARAATAQLESGGQPSVVKPTLTARLARTVAEELLMIPATALVTEPGGACVWTAEEPFVPHLARSVPVEVVGAGPNPGTATIKVVALEAPVLANPSEVLEVSSCR